MKYPHLSETNGMLAAIVAFLFAFLFNSYRMGRLSKTKAIIFGLASLVLIAGIFLIFGKS